MGNRCTVHSKKLANTQNPGISSHAAGAAWRATAAAAIKTLAARIAVLAICLAGTNPAGMFSALVIQQA